jgi:hypothetical protein
MQSTNIRGYQAFIVSTRVSCSMGRVVAGRCEKGATSRDVLLLEA